MPIDSEEHWTTISDFCHVENDGDLLDDFFHPKNYRDIITKFVTLLLQHISRNNQK